MTYIENCSVLTKKYATIAGMFLFGFGGRSAVLAKSNKFDHYCWNSQNCTESYRQNQIHKFSPLSIIGLHLMVDTCEMRMYKIFRFFDIMVTMYSFKHSVYLQRLMYTLCFHKEYESWNGLPNLNLCNKNGPFMLGKSHWKIFFDLCHFQVWVTSLIPWWLI